MPSSAAASLDLIALQPEDTKAFIRFPWQVYEHDGQWVPPLLIERKGFLNPRKNPFFQHAQAQLFLVERHGQVVGRIAAVINLAHDHYHHERAGFFGLLNVCLIPPPLPPCWRLPRAGSVSVGPRFCAVQSIFR